jgi:phytoene synthase
MLLASSAASSSDWETLLTAKAREALQSDQEPVQRPNVPPGRLAQAYAHCEAANAYFSKSFYLASQLLPEEKRRAVRALYMFCRTMDDRVDRPQPDTARTLQAWCAMALAPAPDIGDPVALAWADTCARYRLPRRCIEQFIEGVARDLHQTRYTTFAELAEYCYGVASTVGLMSMHLIGYSGDEAIPYAVKLGVALQITNILRDVAEDYKAGRIYLPADELRAFSLTESDLQVGRVTPAWRDFMRFQIARNRRLYAEAEPGIGLLAPEGRLAIAAAAEFYSAILTDIEDHDYDTFSRRAHVGQWDKLRRLPGLWWRVRAYHHIPSPTPTLRPAS